MGLDGGIRKHSLKVELKSTTVGSESSKGTPVSEPALVKENSRDPGASASKEESETAWGHQPPFN